MKNFIKIIAVGGILFLGYGWYKKNQLDAIFSTYIPFSQGGESIRVIKSVLSKGYGLNLPVNTTALTNNEITSIVNFLESKLGSMNPITQNAINNGSIKLLDLISALPI